MARGMDLGTMRRIALAALLVIVASRDAGAQEGEPEGDAPAAEDEKAATEDSAARSTNATLSDIKDGRLMRYGITAGAAILLQMPRSSDKHQTDRKPIVSPAPYVQALPLIWFINGHISRTYCVARLTEGKVAQTIADEVALKEAGFTSSSFSKSSDLSGGDQDDLAHAMYEAVTFDPEFLSEGQRDILGRYRQHTCLAARERDPERRKELWESRGGETDCTFPSDVPATIKRQDSMAALDWLIEKGPASEVTYLTTAIVKYLVKQQTGWRLGRAASGCGLSTLGVYVALPAAFTTNSDVPSTDHTRVATEFKPIVSGGLALNFSSFASLLIGVTWADSKDERGQNQTIMSWNIGVGGNLDILGALLVK